MEAAFLIIADAGYDNTTNTFVFAHPLRGAFR